MNYLWSRSEKRHHCPRGVYNQPGTVRTHAGVELSPWEGHGRLFRSTVMLSLGCYLLPRQRCWEGY